jgi:hypothetical protein
MDLCHCVGSVPNRQGRKIDDFIYVVRSKRTKTNIICVWIDQAAGDAPLPPWHGMAWGKNITLLFSLPWHCRIRGVIDREEGVTEPNLFFLVHLRTGWRKRVLKILLQVAGTICTCTNSVVTTWQVSLNIFFSKRTWAVGLDIWQRVWNYLSVD